MRRSLICIFFLCFLIQTKAQSDTNAIGLSIGYNYWNPGDQKGYHVMNFPDTVGQFATIKVGDFRDGHEVVSSWNKNWYASAHWQHRIDDQWLTSIELGYNMTTMRFKVEDAGSFRFSDMINPSLGFVSSTNVKNVEVINSFRSVFMGFSTLWNIPKHKKHYLALGAYAYMITSSSYVLNLEYSGEQSYSNSDLILRDKQGNISTQLAYMYQLPFSNQLFAEAKAIYSLHYYQLYLIHSGYNTVRQPLLKLGLKYQWAI